jgi:hypothetical protein
VTLAASSVAPWEERLLDMAYQPLASKNTPVPIAADARTLAHAYAHSAALTQKHSKTFYLASGLLPAEMRPAVRALYAFCRVSDDLVDVDAGDWPGDLGPEAVRRRLARLEAWRRRVGRRARRGRAYRAHVGWTDAQAQRDRASPDCPSARCGAAARFFSGAGFDGLGLGRCCWTVQALRLHRIQSR